jgi:hypothetical protein
MSNTHEPESPESSSDPVRLNVETDGMRGWEEKLAALLLRLLGVYFVACAILSGTNDAIHVFTALGGSNVGVGVDKVLTHYWMYFVYAIAEFIVGTYFLVGGQWVLEKVLIPIIPGPLKDDDDAD